MRKNTEVNPIKLKEIGVYNTNTEPKVKPMIE